MSAPDPRVVRQLRHDVDDVYAMVDSTDQAVKAMASTQRRHSGRLEEIQQTLDLQSGRLQRIEDLQSGQAQRIDDLRHAVDAQGGRLDGLDGRLDGLDGRLDGLNGRLDEQGGRLDGLGGRLDGLDGRLDGLDGRLDGLGGRLDEQGGRLERMEDVQLRILDLLRTRSSDGEGPPGPAA